MDNVGIIAGGGKLPLLVGNILINKNYRVTFFVIKEFYNKKKYKKYKTELIELTSLKNIISVLKKNKIDSVIFLGKVNRPSIKEIKFDIETIRFIKYYFLQNKGDNKLLISIQNYFLKKGFSIFNWIHVCKELFANKIYLTTKKPSKKAILNKNKGIEAFKLFGKSDIGQSMVIQNENILGLEAVEGTDNLLKRCYKYKKIGDKGILIKLSKYNQSKLLDVPTIGLKTLNFVKKYGYEGIFLEINKCIIIDKEQTIKFANDNNIFIASIKK
tara:strand:- start:348 stop:1160 length:813 start_codon:yes stop_codon:yes gene_type:complete